MSLARARTQIVYGLQIITVSINAVGFSSQAFVFFRAPVQDVKPYLWLTFPLLSVIPAG